LPRLVNHRHHPPVLRPPVLASGAINDTMATMEALLA
jgi:hypothetical protein